MPRTRIVISISIAPKTTDNFDFVKAETGLSRGQITDWLVEKEVKRLLKLKAGATKE